MAYFNSSAVKRAEYDAEAMRLTIWFSDGPYDFCGVPSAIWEGLLAAPSKGSFYHRHIRDRYQC